MKTLLLFFLSSFTVFASDLKIQQTEWYRDDINKKLYVKLNISWKNAWHNAKNHDGVWLFFKYLPYPYGENDNYLHGKVATNEHKLIQNHIPNTPNPEFETSNDKIGLFVYPKTN